MQIPIQTEPSKEPALNRPESESFEGEEQSFEETAYVRLKADFDNFKKRQQRDTDEGVTRKVGSFISAFLPIYDDLERAAASSRDNDSSEDLKKGINLICKRVGEFLREQGVERIEAVGKPFDPQKHEAILVQDDSGAPSNTVIEELQPGYLFKKTLLRPTKVKVSK